MRLVVFAIKNYYPAGGWNDVLRGSDKKVLFFESVEEAELAAQAVKDQDYYEVVDLEAGVVVTIGQCIPGGG